MHVFIVANLQNSMERKTFFVDEEQPTRTVPTNEQKYLIPQIWSYYDKSAMAGHSNLKEYILLHSSLGVLIM